MPWAGGVVVPLNVRWAAPEVGFALADSGACMLFLDAAFQGLYESIKGDLGGVEQVIYLDDGAVPQGMLSYEAILAAAEPAEDSGRQGEDLVGIYYTGGTTGRSKGVMLSHRNIVFNAVNAAHTFGFEMADNWLHSAPMFHLADGAATLGITIVGGCHTFVPAFEPEAVFRAIQEHKVTFSVFVPTMVNMLIHHPSFSQYDLTSVRRIIYGASPMPEAVLRKAMELLPTWQFIHGYGMTELSPLATALQWEDVALDRDDGGRLASCGRAAIGVEVRIVDAGGRELPRGEIGEIIVRGDNVMVGYWKRPEETAAALRDGWMWTGDAARMDDDGYVYIVDRVKDMIISGGENVYSAEVEQAVYEHPAVADCAVIGVPDDTWGEKVHAIVVLHSGKSATEDEIIAHCHTLIGGYKCPRSVVFRDQPLPLSGAGKILKTELRKPYWQGHDKGVH